MIPINTDADMMSVFKRLSKIKSYVAYSINGRAKVPANTKIRPGQVIEVDGFDFPTITHWVVAPRPWPKYF